MVKLKLLKLRSQPNSFVCTMPKKQRRLSKRLQRLYEDGKLVESKKEAKKDRLSLQGCTFSPKTNKNRRFGRQRWSTGAATGSAPISDRLHGMAKELTARRVKMTEQMDKECTFSPVLISQQLRRDTTIPIHERLFSLSKTKKPRIQTAVQHETEKCPFAPQLLSRGPKKVRPKNVVDRLFVRDFVQRRTEQLEALKAQTELSGCTFSPETNKRPPKTAPDTHRVFDRLYEDADRVEKRKLMKREEEEARKLDECTFVPEVKQPRQSPRSSTSAFDRLFEEASTRKIRAKQREAQLMQAECPFRPEIHSAPDPQQSVAPRFQTLYEAGQKRQAQRRAEERNLQEYHAELVDEDNLDECTFTPQINDGTGNTPARRVTLMERVSAITSGRTLQPTISPIQYPPQPASLPHTSSEIRVHYVDMEQLSGENDVLEEVEEESEEEVEEVEEEEEEEEEEPFVEKEITPTPVAVVQVEEPAVDPHVMGEVAEDEFESPPVTLANWMEQKGGPPELALALLTAAAQPLPKREPDPMPEKPVEEVVLARCCSADCGQEDVEIELEKEPAEWEILSERMQAAADELMARNDWGVRAFHLMEVQELTDSEDSDFGRASDVEEVHEL